MKTIIEILIDNSRSMGPFKAHNNYNCLMPDGSSRMSFAKLILRNEIISTFDYASKITIRKFHSNYKDNNKFVAEVIYDKDFNFEAISQIIKEIPDPIDTGGTPITAAIEESIEALSKYSDDDRKIILVTDGEENKRGDYKQAAEKALALYGIKCNIFIVGIALTSEAETKARNLAKDTGGQYVNLKAKTYDKAYLQNTLYSFKVAAVAESTQNAINSLNSEPKVSPNLTLSKTNTSVPIQNNTTPNYQHTTTIANTTEDFEIESQVECKTPLISKENLEFKEFQEGQDKMENFSLSLEKNTEIIKLFSKQLELITQEVQNLKKVTSDELDDQEPIITENSELNEKIRHTSEGFLFEKLRSKYGNKVKWLNVEGESFNNHDFEVFEDTNNNSIEYYIECKGSVHSEKVFYMTKNEWHFFLQNTKNYQLYFVSSVLSSPQLIKIGNLFDWLLSGKVVPFALKNTKLKAERIVFTITA